MKNKITFLIFSIVIISGCKNEKIVNQNLKLWYNTPADATVIDDPNGWKDDPEWLKSLPLGNGSLGLMVFGDVNKERIQLNEESMWSGSLSDNDNPEAFKALGKIRELLFEGKYKEATDLTRTTQIASGKGSGHGNGLNVPFGSFQTLGDLYLDFKNKGDYTNYRKELDLTRAVVTVTYTQNEIDYKREYFVSQPHQVAVVKFTASKPASISFTASMTRQERFSVSNTESQIIMEGALSDGNGGDGLKYMSRLSASTEKGTVSYENSSLNVKNADEVTLYLTASTDYLMKYPEFKGRDYKSITNANLEKAKKIDYDKLLNGHLSEYKEYFDRVSFNITPDEFTPIPTDKRLEAFKEIKNDPHLIELMFQYGRYLLIASSRPGTLPANLQGIWSNKLQTPWNGDYHTDVNVEMNYWPAEVTNLPEIHMPLFDLIEMFAEPGKRTAEIQYHAEGWVIHPITNIWGYTAPGESASWGMHTGAGAWISTHIGEHYDYTGDKEFLERMYPVLKGSVEFYLDWLVKDPKTEKWVSGPAVSPENSFVAPDGSKSQFSMGPSHDQQVIWQLFTDFIEASNDLGISDDLVNKVSEVKKDLLLTKIGSDGRLMEWAEEFPEVEPGHRHISHLFALHPGSQINLDNTPELAAAAKKSLDFRIENGGGHTGWSAAWLISQYARLKESAKAKESINTVLSKSTSPNLFGLHPPFQMDANFGTTAGISEMLIQSHTGIIHLLPALPKEWPNGSYSGLKAKGNVEVEVKWKDGEIVEATLESAANREVTISFKDKKVNIRLIAGEKKKITRRDFGT